MQIARKVPGFCLPMIFFVSFSGRLSHAQVKTVAERLGYPKDAKLLIIHGDDLAMSHSVDRASFAAFEKQAISSASIMVPCPWLLEVADYAKQHPDADLGLHLTLTSEWKYYRWGPVSAGVPSLIDSEGYLWADAGPVSSHAKPQEAEREIRAQIDRALKIGIKPTHVDNHMGSLFQNPALFAVYLNVAREYHLPFLAVRPPNASPQMLAMLTDRDIVLDGVVTAHEGVRPEEWKEFYAGMLRTLKPGLTELIVHLGYADAELNAITADHPGWDAAWRRRDSDVVTSREFKTLLEENKIKVIRWRDLQKLLP
jgi:chitin disaccharide deacetylase